MTTINKVSVIICGKEYKLQTDETPEYIMALAALVDKEINDVLRAKPNFGTQNAAVFAALTSLDEAKKARDSIDNIRSQIKFYVDDAAKARVTSTKATVELREMKARVQELEKTIKELEKENKELTKKLAAFDCEQLVLENTISSAVTIYTEEPSQGDGPTDEAAPAENAEPKAQNASNGKEKEQGSEQKEQAEPVGGEASDGKAANDGGDTQHDDVKPAGDQDRQRYNKGGSHGRKKKR